MSYSFAQNPLGINTTPLVCPEHFQLDCPVIGVNQQVDYDQCRCLPCVDPNAWVTTQETCNAQDGTARSTDPNDPCSQAQAQSPPCKYGPYPGELPCPSGAKLLTESIPKRSRTGVWGTVTVSRCVSPLSPTLAAQGASRNWGLLLGLGIAAVVVYKIATG